MISDERYSEITLENIASSDCGVIAIQAVSGLSRVEAEKLAKANGYRPGVGVRRGEIAKALRSQGMTVSEVRFDYRTATPAHFSLTHEYGLYLIYTDEHVMALVEGDLRNSRGCWGKPIEQIQEVIR